jgi:drug/metabolite transporter (DMT)-like permease
LILYLNPTLVLVLGWVLYKRKISYRQGVAMAVSYGGVLLVFAHEISWVGENVFLGTGLVFLSAVTYAIYLTYSGQLVQRLGAMRLAGLATTVACFLCIVQFAVLEPLQALNVAPEVIWLSLLNAIACTVLPVLMVMMAIERIGASLTSQIGMIGPMSTLTMAALLLDEPLTVWILIGTALVVGGVYWVTQSPKVVE